jgi:micrococcal nuclease
MLTLLLAILLIVAMRTWPRRDAGSSPASGPPGGAPGSSVPHSSVPPAAETLVRVERVVDGDTLVIEGGVRVRLIGVDTPESAIPDVPPEPLGPEASEFTRRFVASARNRLRLTFDREPYDRHGRRLAWAWNGDTLLNEELVRAGFSRAVTVHPYSEPMKDRLRAVEREAKRSKLGIWNRNTVGR